MQVHIEIFSPKQAELFSTDSVGLTGSLSSAVSTFCLDFAALKRSQRNVSCQKDMFYVKLVDS